MDGSLATRAHLEGPEVFLRAFFVDGTPYLGTITQNSIDSDT
jgi:hypothetical protein